MISETGYTWVDVDNICLSSNWPLFRDDFVLGYEFHDWLGKDHITNSVLGYKKDSQFADYLLCEAHSFDKTAIFWDELGAGLLQKGIQTFGYENYIQKRSVFNPIECKSWGKLWSNIELELVLRETKDSLTVNCYHEMSRRAGIDRNHFPTGSALDYFWNKYF